MAQSTLLIIKPSSLGDIIHGLLVARMIKAGRPEAVIHWVCRDTFAPLVRACPVVDKVLLFHRNAGPGALVRLIREIRERRYDHVLDFQGLARSGILTLCSRANQKVGRIDAREGSRFCYDRLAPLPATGRKAHAVDILAEFLPILGLPARIEPRLPMRIPRMNPRHVPFGSPILVFPQSRRAEKNWPGYQELAISLASDAPDTVIAWAGAESMPCPQADGLPNFTNLTGNTTLSELIALTAHARLVVGNDSGPLHLAAALGTPTLALFGPTDPQQYRPYPGDELHNHVLRAPGGRFATLTCSAVLCKIQELLQG